jgi:hypothetical protein
VVYLYKKYILLTLSLFITLIGCSQNTSTEPIREEMLASVGVVVELIEKAEQSKEPLGDHVYEITQVVVDKYDLMNQSNDLNKTETTLLDKMMGLVNRYSEYVDTKNDKDRNQYELTLEEIKELLNSTSN